jgi:coproporphyrinogen III oxidase-like Fe-S oxidoreductase
LQQEEEEEEEDSSAAAAAAAAKCFSQKSVNKPRSTQNYVNKRTARNEIVRQTTRQEEREMEKDGKLHSRRTDKEADAKHLEKRREEQRRSIDAREKQGRGDKEKAARTAGTNKP